MKIEWTVYNTKRSLSIIDLIEKLERSLGLRRDECKQHIRSLSWDKIKIKNKRTGEIIRRG